MTVAARKASAHITKLPIGMVLAILAAAFVVPAKAPGAGPASVAISSSTASLPPAGGSGSYEIALTAGPEAADFSIDVTPPEWPDPRIVGSPLAFLEPAIAGEGTVRLRQYIHGSPRPGVCAIANGPISLEYAVTMPANTSATVSLPYVTTMNPWVDIPISTKISVGGAAASPTVVTGQLDPWVSAWPKSEMSEGRIKTKARKPFRLAGRAFPARAGKVRLLARSIYSRGETVPLGTFKVNRSGRFATGQIVIRKWGTYRIDALWIKPERTLSNCSGLAIEVKRRPGRDFSAGE